MNSFVCVQNSEWFLSEYICFYIAHGVESFTISHSLAVDGAKELTSLFSFPAESIVIFEWFVLIVCRRNFGFD